MERKGSRIAAIREGTAAFLQKRGFYVVLGLCILCIGIAAAVALLPGKTAPPASTPPSQAQAAGMSEDERLQEAARPTPAATVAITPAPTPAATQKPAATATPKKPQGKAAPPVPGAVIWGYAMDTLLYSETLEQWTTHEGVDLKAKAGDEVIVIRAGTVSRVFEDDALGVCVEVKHDGGLTSLYGNLMSDPPVTEGERLDAGDTVGYTGATALSECGMEPHVHFALYQNGKSVDPTAYVLLGA